LLLRSAHPFRAQSAGAGAGARVPSAVQCSAMGTFRRSLLLGSGESIGIGSCYTGYQRRHRHRQCRDSECPAAGVCGVTLRLRRRLRRRLGVFLGGFKLSNCLISRRLDRTVRRSLVCTLCPVPIPPLLLFLVHPDRRRPIPPTDQPTDPPRYRDSSHLETRLAPIVSLAGA
jgi:hypothetical protein